MIKASDILKTVKELGERFPDRRAGCQYFYRNGHPCCIVGHALRKHGLRMRDLPNFGVNGTGLGAAIDSGDLPIEVDIDDLQLRRLCNVQMAQDEEKPWGEAIQELG